jgi:hypothetical protein
MGRQHLNLISFGITNTIFFSPINTIQLAASIGPAGAQQHKQHTDRDFKDQQHKVVTESSIICRCRSQSSLELTLSLTMVARPTLGLHNLKKFAAKKPVIKTCWVSLRMTLSVKASCRSRQQESTKTENVYDSKRRNDRHLDHYERHERAMCSVKNDECVNEYVV